MKFRSLWLAAAISTAAAFNPAIAEEGLVDIGDPELVIDDSGIASIAGDVLADYQVSRVELLVNGEYKADIPLVDGEPAVDNGLSDILGPGYTDFSGAAFLGFLQPGTHDVSIRVTDAQGNVQEITTPVEIPNFFPESIDDPDVEGDGTGPVDFSGATLNAVGNTLQVDNLQINGNSFNVTLECDPDTGSCTISSALPLDVFLDSVGDDPTDGTDTADPDIDSDDFLSDAWFLQQVDPEDRWVFE